MLTRATLADTAIDGDSAVRPPVVPVRIEVGVADVPGATAARYAPVPPVVPDGAASEALLGWST